jgi:hypothetical protein
MLSLALILAGGVKSPSPEGMAAGYGLARWIDMDIRERTSAAAHMRFIGWSISS